MENLIFKTLSSLLVFTAIMVIFSYNSVYSVLFLILSYISAAGLLLILKCEFLGLIFTTIYVGAVAVLFLFVILMLDIKSQNLNTRLIMYSDVLSLSFVFLVELTLLILKNFKKTPFEDFLSLSSQTLSGGGEHCHINDSANNWFLKVDVLKDVETFGQLLSTNFVMPLLISGLILLLGVIGAVVLTSNRKQKQKQISYKQLSRNFKNSLTYPEKGYKEWATQKNKDPLIDRIIDHLFPLPELDTVTIRRDPNRKPKYTDAELALQKQIRAEIMAWERIQLLQAKIRLLREENNK